MPGRNADALAGATAPPKAIAPTMNMYMRADMENPFDVARCERWFVQVPSVLVQCSCHLHGAFEHFVPAITERLIVAHGCRFVHCGKSAVI